jgi:hypothetical protein
MKRFKYIGGIERIDIWVDLNATGRDAILMTWDDTPSEWRFFTDTGYYAHGTPTPEERSLVLHYVALFVPELGLVMEESDGT